MARDHEQRRSAHKQLSSTDRGGGKGSTIRTPFDPKAAASMDKKARSSQIAAKTSVLLVIGPRD
jgi:hypothetical protein